MKGSILSRTPAMIQQTTRLSAISLFGHQSHLNIIKSLGKRWLSQTLHSWEKHIQPQLKELKGKEIQVKVGTKYLTYNANVTPLTIGIENKKQKFMDKVIAAQVGNTIVDLKTPIGLLQGFKNSESLDINFCTKKNLDQDHPQLLRESINTSGACLINYSLHKLFGDSFIVANDNNYSNVSDHEYLSNQILVTADFSPQKTLTQKDLSTIRENLNTLKLNMSDMISIPTEVGQLKKLFADNMYKLDMLDRLDPKEQLLLYKIGSYIDFSPARILHPDLLYSVDIESSSAVYWLQDANNRQLQCLHGTAFSTKEESMKYAANQQRKKDRDHRVIGKAMKLFMIHKCSPGSPILLPRGQRLFNNLQQVLRKEYMNFGFDEVSTPMIFDKSLWETSGHWDMYQKDMFLINGDGNESEMGVKPMNCPAHCVIYSNEGRSYKELPLRLADFSALHRNEISGALTGLTRVRKFHQDDGHIFCSPNDILQEISMCIEMTERLYKRFGFEYTLSLSTRPEKSIGTDEDWEHSEKQLRQYLEESNHDFAICEGDGAFYGPKIDIHVTDYSGKRHQTATLQLDFNLPQRFDLNYIDENGNEKRPVIIHRAILGSFERMMALLIEHFEGRFPLWLSPTQVMIFPLFSKNKEQIEYSKKLCQKLRSAGILADLDLADESFNKKIKTNRSIYNYCVVIGDTEIKNEEVSIRGRLNFDSKNMKIAEFIESLHNELEQ